MYLRVVFVPPRELPVVSYQLSRTPSGLRPKGVWLLADPALGLAT